MRSVRAASARTSDQAIRAATQASPPTESWLHRGWKGGSQYKSCATSHLHESTVSEWFLTDESLAFTDEYAQPRGLRLSSSVSDLVVQHCTFTTTVLLVAVYSERVRAGVLARTSLQGKPLAVRSGGAWCVRDTRKRLTKDERSCGSDGPHPSPESDAIRMLDLICQLAIQLFCRRVPNS